MAVHLDRVDARGKLKPRRGPYWQRLAAGRFLGFRYLSAASCGNWLARVYEGQKKYVQRPLGDFDTLPEKQRFDAARKAADEWFSHLDVGGSTDTASVKSACEAYVEHLKIENSETASLDAAGRFRRLVYGDPIAGVDLSKLTALQVAGWKKRVLAKGGTHGSFNRNATALRAALNLARKRRCVASDHAWIDELAPFEDADGRRDLYLARPGRRKLIQKAAKEAQPFIRALALMPLRPGDVANLDAGHLDSRHGILAVPRGKTRSRLIPLSGETLAHVRACAKGKRPADPLFCRADGRRWDRFAWREAINDSVAAAKLPEAVCAYTLRHSAITDLIVSGLDLFHVAQLGGTSIAMIEKHYGHLQRRQVREGLQVLGLK
jgi:integrase